MKQQWITTLCLPVVLILLFSCQSKEKMILGTWLPVSPEGKRSDVKIKFLENNKVVAQNQPDSERNNDTATYEIREKGQLLVTTSKSGITEELVIVELSNRKLVMHLMKDKRDTMRFVRE